MLEYDSGHFLTFTLYKPANLAVSKLKAFKA